MLFSPYTGIIFYITHSIIFIAFLIRSQGMHLGMGGNPYGPAGTGKTESVKALGCLLGRQVLVFNCDEVTQISLVFKSVIAHLFINICRG